MKATSNSQNRELLKPIALTLSILIFSLTITIPSTIALPYNILHDANRNRIQDNQFYYEYNNFNQLSRVRLNNATGQVIEDCIYDENGNRILKRDLYYSAPPGIGDDNASFD